MTNTNKEQMKLRCKLLSLIITLLIVTNTSAQDYRTLDTKIADMMMLIPAGHIQLKDKLMEDLSAMGDEALVKISSKIVPPGTGDDTKKRFVIESYSRYLSHLKDADLISRWEKIVIDMIEKNSDSDVKMFFMQQLDYIGTGRTIDALSKYIGDTDLNAPAIKAMWASDKKKAAEVFAAKLGDVEDRQLIGLVNAIGNLQDAKYTESLIAVYPSEDKFQVKLAVLKALSKFNDPEATKFLASKAKDAGYNYEDTKAVGSLLRNIEVISNSDKKNAEKLAKTVLKKSTTEIYRINADLLLADMYSGKKQIKLLLAGLREKDRSFRGAVIEKIVKLDPEPGPWLAELKKTKNIDTQKELLYLFARLGNKTVSNDIKEFIFSADAGVRNEALMTYTLLNRFDALPVIFDYMKSYSDTADASIVQQVLNITIGKDNADKLMDNYPEFTPAMKMAALNTFGYKHIGSAHQLMLEAVTDEDPVVKGAAYENLKYVVSGSDLRTLLSKFEGCSSEKYRNDLSKAIVEAVNRSKDRDAAVSLVMSVVDSKPNKAGYIDILSGIGGSKALSIVKELYDKGNGKEKEDALTALTDWNDLSVVYALYDICSNTESAANKDKAYKSYIEHVSSSSVPDDQKLLLIRKIMALAGNKEQKIIAIKALANVKTYLTYVFLKQFLDDEELKSDAAFSLANVIMPSSGEDDGLKGRDVKEVLKKARDIVAKSERQYIVIDIDACIASLKDETGFVSIFNGKDLTGWHGYTANPLEKRKMSKYKLEKLQKEADKHMLQNWSVENGILKFNGNKNGKNLCTVKDDYSDFEMIIDWRIGKDGDSGIYLRGFPQVQIWDTARVDVDARVGSGGLYNNKKHRSTPLVAADNPVGDWNTFRIKMVGNRVTVYLNGRLVVDNEVLENYFDYGIPVFAKGDIELQAHNSPLEFRDIFIKELDFSKYNRLTKEEKKEGFKLLFNGKNLDGWIGDTVTYYVEDGMIQTHESKQHHGNGFMYADKKYKDFIFRFEFKLLPSSNNGLGIHVPDIDQPHPAYSGMEIQILDNSSPVFANLQPYQYHGSLYGVMPAERGFLKPVREWNTEEVIIKGTHIKVTLNGHVILDGDWAEASKNGTLDHKDHPGLKVKEGYTGFLGHSSKVYFRNIRIKEL